MQESGRDIKYCVMFVESLPMEELACCAVCNDGEWIEGVSIILEILNSRILSFFVTVVILECTHRATATH